MAMLSAIRNSEQWERLPGRLGAGPQARAEATAILAGIRGVIDAGLTAYEQRVFVAIVVDGIALGALAARPGVRLFWTGPGGHLVCQGAAWLRSLAGVVP